MASQSTIKAFIAQWSSAASAAGKALGIEPAYVLAQWAMESNYGQSPAGTNNVAGIKCSGRNCSSNGFQNFTSQASFANAYVKSVSSDFSYFQSSKVPFGSRYSTAPSVSEVFGSYVPGHAYASIPASSYASRVSSFLNALGTTGTQTPNSASPTPGVSAPSGPGIFGNLGQDLTNAITSPFTSLFHSVVNPIESFAMGLVGVVLIGGGIVLLVLSDPKTTKTVKTVAKTAAKAAAM